MSFRFLTGLFCLAVFCACNNQDQTAGAGGVTVKNDSLSNAYQKLDTALSFAGLWVNEKYVNGLLKIKSPSNMEIPPYSCMIIPARTLQETSVIEGFHEGGPTLTIFKNGSRYEFWDKEEKKKWTDVQLAGEDRMKIGNEYLVRLRSGDLSKDPNPFNIVDIVLFAGKFRDENGNIIEFTKDGKVKGLKGSNVYEATLDYAAAEPQLDELKLGATAADMKGYAFKFNNDTLKIFEVACKEMARDSICLESVFGREHLTLIREK